MMFCYLRSNVEASCCKLFRCRLPTNNTSPFTATGSECRQLATVWCSVLHLAVEPLTTRNQAGYWSRITFAYSTDIRSPHKGFPVRILPYHLVWKIEWCDYTRWWKKLKIMFIRFDCRIHGRTDAARRHRPRLYIASRGKNEASYRAAVELSSNVCVDVHSQSLTNQSLFVACCVHFKGR